MSRGLGTLERAIIARIEKCRRRDAEEDGYYAQTGAEPPTKPVLVTAGALWFDINNPGYRYQTHETHRPAKGATEAQLKAAKRAMHSFVRKFPQYGVMSAKGGRGRLCTSTLQPRQQPADATSG